MILFWKSPGGSNKYSKTSHKSLRNPRNKKGSYSNIRKYEPLPILNIKQTYKGRNKQFPDYTGLLF